MTKYFLVLCLLCLTGLWSSAFAQWSGDTEKNTLKTDSIIPSASIIRFKVLEEKNIAGSNYSLAITNSSGMPLSIPDGQAIWSIKGVNQQEQLKLPASQIIQIRLGVYSQPTLLSQKDFYEVIDLADIKFLPELGAYKCRYQKRKIREDDPDVYVVFLLKTILPEF